jgi:2-amino-4-hydroxy-6-hydroxymethyldihydropteridine diphosphokinase
VDRAVGLPVAIAFGSNLGDRHRALAFAVERLAAFITDLTVSSPIETEPEGEGVGDQPLYLNAVAVGRTDLDAASLLDALHAIEDAHGRERPFPNAPRTLDLDLVLLGTGVTDRPGLQVPHPRFRERFFVLGPLAEVAPNMVDPVTGLKVWELLRNLLADARR